MNVIITGESQSPAYQEKCHLESIYLMNFVSNCEEPNFIKMSVVA